jgi:hypothetical protein
MLKKFSVVLLSLLLAFACSRSLEGEKNSFKMTKDKLEVTATKNPMLKSDIAMKTAEFNAEFNKILSSADSEEAKIKALSSLNYRMNQYNTNIMPVAPKTNKLNTTTPVNKTGLGMQPATTTTTPMPTNGLGMQPATTTTTPMPTNGLGMQPATTTTPALDNLGKKTDTSSVPALDGLGTKTNTNSVPALDSTTKTGTSKLKGGVTAPKKKLK